MYKCTVCIVYHCTVYFYVRLDYFQVDIYLLTTENDDVGRYKEKEREWLNIATVSTDKHGRAWYDMTEEEIPRAAGVYPVIFLVKYVMGGKRERGTGDGER